MVISDVVSSALTVELAVLVGCVCYVRVRDGLPLLFSHTKPLWAHAKVSRGTW